MSRREEADLRAAWEAWVARAFSDAEFAGALHGLDIRLAFRSDDEALMIRLAPEGGATDNAAPADISIAAPEAGWREVMSAAPAPGWHSFSALLKANSEAVVEGEPLRIAQALHALERLFELARPAPTVEDSASARNYDAVTGRYADVSAGGRRAKIYYETAGEGPPLVMLHTAGADSRQWLAQLADPELQRSWRMIAFDMPWHGRSFAPDDWDGAPYGLTQSEYAAWCVGFIRDVVGAPPVVMGCSMGACMAVTLAALHPDEIQGVVAVEAPAEGPPRLAPELRRPDVDSSAHSPSYVRGLMSPGSALTDRRRACWIYSQSGLGVYAGDLRYYSQDYDGLALAPKIDTRRTPVTFLTGAYDFSASPADTRRLAQATPGSEFEEMANLGHFPMVEAPDRFRRFLLPALAAMRAKLSAA